MVNCWKFFYKRLKRGFKREKLVMKDYHFDFTEENIKNNLVGRYFNKTVLQNKK